MPPTEALLCKHSDATSSQNVFADIQSVSLFVSNTVLYLSVKSLHFSLPLSAGYISTGKFIHSFFSLPVSHLIIHSTDLLKTLIHSL